MSESSPSEPQEWWCITCKRSIGTNHASEDGHAEHVVVCPPTNPRCKCWSCRQVRAQMTAQNEQVRHG